MDPDEKSLREHELAEQGRSRRVASRNGWLTLVIGVAVQVVLIYITGQNLEQSRNATDQTLSQAREVSDQTFVNQRTQYLTTQQRAAYKVLLDAARGESVTALKFQRSLRDGESADFAISDLQPSIDQCRRAFLDVALLGPDPITGQARIVSNLCSELNKSLVDRLRAGTDQVEARAVRRLREDLGTANRDFLREALGVVQMTTDHVTHSPFDVWEEISNEARGL